MERERSSAVVALSALAALVGLCAGPGLTDASARAFKPPKGKIWHGVSDTGSLEDFRQFRRQVRHHPPLLQTFLHWGVPLTTGALERWERSGTRGVVSLSTAPGGGTEVITPREIAKGRDDHYLLRLGQSIAKSGQVVYVRPFGEMNLYYQPYSAYNANGTLRSKKHRTRWFRLAWRRMVLIVRGGPRRKVNRKLRKLGLPRILRAKREDGPIYRERRVPETLKEPKVAFMWTPMTISNPYTTENGPMAYFPGRRYVDWVGTDIYAKYATPGVWRALNSFFRSGVARGMPFVIGEYGPWDNDRSGRFVRRLFRWAKKRRRVKALLYFRSVDPHNAFNLQHYPGARRALRRLLNSRRFPTHAPGTRKPKEDGPPSGGTSS